MVNKTNKSTVHKLDDYLPIVGKNTIDELKLLADHLRGIKVQNINSTYSGGGVAEILNRMVPLLNQLGIDATWDVIRGDERFFDITKKIHNALHGMDQHISQEEYDHYLDINRQNLDILRPGGNIYFIHDPQPAMLISRKNETGGRWIWRCHVDVSNPDDNVWQFLEKTIEKYDAVIFSAPNFAHPLDIRQFIISPSIDPLSDKNIELSRSVIENTLNKYGIDPEKPSIVQISRFDRLKDPVGVIQAFKMVKKGIDCQLVLAGGTATDDPEYEGVLKDVMDYASDDKDIKVLLIPPESDIEINALQRAATIIIQKSLKEGFGLTISEALWKSKPVVATAVGGIPLQVINKYTGLLCYSIDGAAYALKQLLTNSELAAWLGKNGREHIRQNFLITRHLKEYMLLFIALNYQSEIIYL
jgi:trehalose synthase